MFIEFNTFQKHSADSKISANTGAIHGTSELDRSEIESPKRSECEHSNAN